MYSLIIVDDENITRMAISGYIRRTHPEFSIAGVFSNGADALSFLCSHSVNIVITDIRMPNMDGLALAEQIFRKFPGITIMIISGYSEFEYARRAISYGVSTYLLKPLDFAELSRNLLQAKEKLDALHIDTGLQEEDIQLFFTDLIGGMIHNNEELQQRFVNLPFNGKLSDYHGCLLTITIEKNDALTQWKYGKEQLAVALLNTLRMALTEYRCFHLFRSGMRYYFIVLSEGRLPDFSPEMLDNVLYDLLHFSCVLQVQTVFSNLEEPATFHASKDTDILQNGELAESKQLSENVSPAASNGASETNDDLIIQKAMSYIQAHYAEDLTREDVADAVFLSSAYFSRFFKQKTGLNFIDYQTTVRMQKAAELLSTHMKVGDIARKVGYQSRNRFFINFRQYSGYNPTEYRRQILKMEDGHEEEDV